MRWTLRTLRRVLGCLMLAAGVVFIGMGVNYVMAVGRVNLTDFILWSAGLAVCLAGLKLIVGFRRRRPEDEEDEPEW